MLLHATLAFFIKCWMTFYASKFSLQIQVANSRVSQLFFKFFVHDCALLPVPVCCSRSSCLPVMYEIISGFYTCGMNDATFAQDILIPLKVLGMPFLPLFNLFILPKSNFSVRRMKFRRCRKNRTTDIQIIP